MHKFLFLSKAKLQNIVKHAWNFKLFFIFFSNFSQPQLKIFLITCKELITVFIPGGDWKLQVLGWSASCLVLGLPGKMEKTLISLSCSCLRYSWRTKKFFFWIILKKIFLLLIGYFFIPNWWLFLLQTSHQAIERWLNTWSLVSLEDWRRKFYLNRSVKRFEVDF